jgi:hypothetical protein
MRLRLLISGLKIETETLGDTTSVAVVAPLPGQELLLTGNSTESLYQEI